MTVNASDSNPGINRENHAQTYIYITVTDYNDEVPIFEKSTIPAKVSEADDIGTPVAKFSATDRDVNPAYGSFTYVLLSTFSQNE